MLWLFSVAYEKSLVVRPVYNRKIFVYAPVTSDGELHVENMNIFYVN